MKKYLFSVLFVLSGCSAVDLAEQKKVDIESSSNVKGLEVISFPAQLRGTFVYTDDNNKKTVCSEPFTDVGASSTIKASAKAANNLSLIAADTNNSSEQSVKLGMEAINQIVSLEGRTQFVLLAREMLFRICEAAANGFYTNAGTNSVFDQQKEVIQAMTTMLRAQEAVAKAEQKKATLEIVKSTNADVKVWLDANEYEVILKSFKDDLDTCLSNASGNQTIIDKCHNDYISKIDSLYK